MKRCVLAFIAVVLVSGSVAAKNTVYLEPKVKFDRGSPGQGFNTSMTHASFTPDSRFMGVSIYLYRMPAGGGMNMRTTGMLFDLERGALVKSIRNGSLYIANDEILITQLDDIWDEFVPSSKLVERSTPKALLRLDQATLSATEDVSSRITLPEDHVLVRDHTGYRLSAKGNDFQTTYVWQVAGEELVLRHRLNIAHPQINRDGTLVSGQRGTSVEVYDLESGKRLHRVRMGDPTSGILHHLTRDGRLVHTKLDTRQYPARGDLVIRDLRTGKILKTIDGLVHGVATFDVDKNEETLLVSVPQRGEVYFIDLSDYSILGKASYGMPDQARDGGFVKRIGESDNFLLQGGSESIFYIVNSVSRAVTADVYVDQEGDWAVVSRDGRVDGSPGAMDKLEWREYDGTGQVVNTTSLSMAFTNFFTPSLLPSILRDDVGDSGNLLAQLAQAPTVVIDSPATGYTTDTGEVVVTVSASAEGDSIKAINVFVNNKLVNEDTRGVSIDTTGNQRTLTIGLAPGNNVISARAISARNFESAVARVEVMSTKGQPTSKLFLMVIGIDEYANPAYNLNYATADASAIVMELQKRAASIFDGIEVRTLFNQQATRNNVMDTFADIQARARPDDVFVFFYAGHGVMSETDPDFYLALHNVTQLYGKDDLLASEGVSARTLRDLMAANPAQKQMILLDACQSGGAVQTFALRGAAEEKAIVQLARSTGVTLLASTGTEQFATEFGELGHGVFTYALLNGLRGAADGGSRDRKVTVKELEAYLNDQVPELTQKHKGTVQYPRSWSQGMDFPISIIN